MISPRTEHPELRIKGIVKAFGGNRALGGIDLAFSQAGLVALVGPNGAGKTTLISILSGFLHADSGRWFINGTEATTLPSFRIARLGLIRTFQEVRIIRSMSVLENLMLALSQSGSSTWPARDRSARDLSLASRFLEAVNIIDLSSQPAGALSYGQQKLLSLACCFATKASILICDEPLAGVDPLNAERIAQLLVAYSRTDRLIIFIEHDIGLVRKLAERVVVLDHGLIIADGPARVLDLPAVAEAFLG